MVNLKSGLDFRLPAYRREVFLKFYEFHLKYRTNPGCVYFLMPYIANEMKFDKEEKLWFAFLNGNTQNPVMSYLIWTHFPRLDKLDIKALSNWFNNNWTKFAWDTDRRYQKKDFIPAVENYALLTNGNQVEYFNALLGKDEYESFENIWKAVRKDFLGFGRLSAFSYSEYLRIMGIPLDCNNLFLEDISGSASHRNGLAIVLGRDDLDFHHDTPTYKFGEIDWLKLEAKALLDEAKERFNHRDFIKDVSYFTLESVLCTYKSWHRPNRRYPNIYADMLHDRIKWAEEQWHNEDFEIFWNARTDNLPWYLRQEDNVNDPGLSKSKQNHYLETGEVVMMSKDFPEFSNQFDRRLWSATY